MSKRQERILYQELNSKLSSLVNKTVSVVLTNGVVFYGEILNFNNSVLSLENKRLSAHKIELHTIYEIIIDKEDLLDTAKS